MKEPNDCDGKEVENTEKMQKATAEVVTKQLDRLTSMKRNSMKVELKQRINKRINILKQL
jgi:hypothetical protein